MSRLMMIATATAVLFGGFVQAASAAGTCTPVASLHLYGNDRFDLTLPTGVIMQGPPGVGGAAGSTPVSFYLDLNSVPGLKPRLQYNEPTGMLRIENGFLTGSGADWDIYPTSAACRELTARVGRYRSVRATSPGDPSTLPQNSITVEGR